MKGKKYVRSDDCYYTTTEMYKAVVSIQPLAIVR